MSVIMNAFTGWDYGVFFATLLFSMGIGVYFAVQGRKKKTEGATYLLSSLGMAGGSLLAAVVIVPFLYPLHLTSSFEYLEKRYNSKAARLVGTCMQIVAEVIYMGAASFAPSTALNIVTGFPVWATLLIMMTVSTFYTSIGGMKAVIWTDVFQSAVMVAGVLAIIIQGSIKVGGLSKVWDINDNWGRLNVWNFNPDPTIRHSFWSMTVGVSLKWMGLLGLSQAAIQRYNSLPTLKEAQRASYLIIFGANIITIPCCVSGLVIFAYYVMKDCDPISKKLVDNSNQLVPFFVMETLSYPCVPGIFISALFSGALSSVSSSLNSLAAITWEDILKPVFNKDGNMTTNRKLLIIKGSVVFYGVLALAFGLIIKNLEGTVLQISISFSGAVRGPVAGMFILGALFPWANAKGAIGGALISMALCFWIAVGAFVTGVPKDHFTYPNGTCSEYFTNDSIVAMTTTLLPTTIQHPTTSMTDVIGMSSSHVEKTGIEKLYTLSYLWYLTLGVLSTVVFGIIISFITGANKMDDVPTEYQIPLASRVLCCLPRTWQRRLNCNRDFEDPKDMCDRLKQDAKKTSSSDYKPMSSSEKLDLSDLASTPDVPMIDRITTQKI